MNGKWTVTPNVSWNSNIIRLIFKKIPLNIIKKILRDNDNEISQPTPRINVEGKEIIRYKIPYFMSKKIVTILVKFAFEGPDQKYLRLSEIQVTEACDKIVNTFNGYLVIVIPKLLNDIKILYFTAILYQICNVCIPNMWLSKWD